MVITALDLINRAYYLSQVVSRELQTVSGSQIQDGLYMLNALLDVKGSDLHLIPYFQLYEFPAIAGQEMYFIPNLLYADSITFNIGPVRYPMSELSRKAYFGTARVDNIQSLPFSYRVERTLDGSNLFLYFLPESNYDMKIWGKFGLTDVTITQDLSLVYDFYYIEYLRFALAEYICTDYGATFPDATRAKYMEIRKKLMSISPADLSLQKRNYFTGGAFWDWQSINLAKGWWPF